MFPASEKTNRVEGPVRCRERLGGLPSDTTIGKPHEFLDPTGIEEVGCTVVDGGVGADLEAVGDEVLDEIAYEPPRKLIEASSEAPMVMVSLFIRPSKLVSYACSITTSG